MTFFFKDFYIAVGYQVHSDKVVVRQTKYLLVA
jgi:hypothetical protein